MPAKKSEKPKVVEFLYERHLRGELPEGIVTNRDIVAAIRATGADLRQANPANFLKDIVRTEHANSNWPERLKSRKITARQRYGETRVFQFVPYAAGQREPFPDNFVPTPKTPVYTVQSASMSFVARRLGRKEETWLTQVAVNLRLIETQLSIFSPLHARVRDVTHLQMGMKTQPEIDAVFLASYGATQDLSSPTELHVLITCEAKQIRERLLEDQIREQLAMAMKTTAVLKNPVIDAVKPMAIKVVEREFRGHPENCIYVVEFGHVTRAEFASKWLSTEESLYSMPLNPVSEQIYRITPPVAGLNA